ncbi:ABC transporter ATP-binding protein [Clostridium sp. CM028]|uniref:ABC transporter ATP-binding protein n=1 Tax=unclassified Clostridium TaxID=2614128 RepID=UPI001C0D7492|nr:MULTISPECIES: ABC transporter ATP-binding protein [unclassified Clostridium]MBU3092394.1 ABC transporter ATP-binding protein [Clostridium sp. CF011]MBW9146023.1 ABC transporter ATP-binding protein [Clostridium sp. CM027]MBW9149889.1 ABC transporter ATP-binding protein [Clostridium sp. CM028]UVE39493.1 ABC transporter ATP-binding protein [Clostridium sp. CM027]WAG68405.1 ABC transporter ATP-binding protein [Clostridium sp. CF011]
MLSIKDLSKKYSNNFWGIQNFDLELKERELVSIVGPNGSGKTTIINCLLGVISPTKGTLSLYGQKNNTKKFKEYIAYVPDELLLIESLTGKEYINFVKSMYQNVNDEKIKKLVQIYNMAEAMEQIIKNYSHGMKKKLQLIAAFMLEGKLMVLDEPFRGLDVESIITTKKMLRKFLKDGKSILMSTHDLLLADSLSDRIVIISKGRKVAENTSNILKKEYNCNSLEEVFIKASLDKSRSDKIDEVINNL